MTCDNRRPRSETPSAAADYMQALGGGVCFAHGPYTEKLCPHWPKCATDPQKPEFVAMGISVSGAGFGWTFAATELRRQAAAIRSLLEGQEEGK